MLNDADLERYARQAIMPDTGGRQIETGGRPETTGANQKNTRCQQARLTLFANIGHDGLAGITFKISIIQH